MNFRKVIPLTLLGLAFFAPDSSALLTGVHSHTTTLLPNGNIMVTGGITATGVTISSVQIYNMAVSSWTLQGEIGGVAAVKRSSHTATLMGDGTILVAGGFDETGTPTDQAFIYDPSANTWAATPAMDIKRAAHTATLINTGTNAGNVLLCGGRTTVAASPSCRMYNRLAGTFSSPSNMSSNRIGHTATAITGGRVFISGGKNGNTYLPTNEIYDPEADQWQTVSALNQGRAEHSAAGLNNGFVMIAGGYNAQNLLTCKAGAKITDDECWYIDQYLRGSNVGDTNRQNPGSHGYLDGAEFFDQNGGRVVLSGAGSGVAPFRFYHHSAVLLPDGQHHIHGGYGNIAPTYFNAGAELDETSSLMTVPIPDTPDTARIVPTGSVISWNSLFHAKSTAAW